MVELICDFDWKLIIEPDQTLISQLLQSLREQVIALYDCQFRANLSLEVDDACKAKCKDQFQHHEVSKGGEIVVLVLFVLVTDEEMDEDV